MLKNYRVWIPINNDCDTIITTIFQKKIERIIILQLFFNPTSILLPTDREWMFLNLHQKNDLIRYFSLKMHFKIKF